MTKSGNPYHEPAGSSKGGQFAHSPGGAEDAARGAAGLDTRVEQRELAIKDFHATTHARALSEGYQELEYEMGWLTTPDGEFIFEVAGEQDSIWLSDAEQAKLPGNHMVHNHPLGGPFSGQDIQMGIVHQMSGISVTNSDQNHTMLLDFPSDWDFGRRESEAKKLGRIYSQFMADYRAENSMDPTLVSFTEGLEIWNDSGIAGLEMLDTVSPWADYIEYSYKDWK